MAWRFEKAGGITAMIFDKTGTLTVGQPEVSALFGDRRQTHPNSSRSEASSPVQDGPKFPSAESEVLLASALARHSTHPISQAIARISSSENKAN